MKNNWETKNIKEISQVVTGKTPPTAIKEYFGDKFPFITPTDITGESRFINKPDRYLSNKGYEYQRNLAVPNNSICFTCIGSTVGKMAITNRVSFTNQQINSIIVDSSIADYRYIFYILKTQIERIKNYAGGAAKPIINKSIFEEIPISCFSLPIQRKIADILSAYDDLIEINERRVKILEEVGSTVKELLDESIESIAKYEISEPEELKDLSKIDFEKIKTVLDKDKKHIAAERLKQKIKNKLDILVKMNPSRLTFAEKFQKFIDEYNVGAKSVEEFFDELIDFAGKLNEEKRGLSEQLTEEELAIYDLLFKPDLKRKDIQEIKKIAKELLLKLKKEKLVLDWRKKQQTRADVIVTIKDILNEQLPESYDTETYIQKSDLIYRHIYDSYYGEGKSIYSISGVAA